MIDNSVNVGDFLSPNEQLSLMVLKPIDGSTQGSSEHPCHIFGNGVEIENRVCSRATHEGKSTLGRGNRMILKQDLRLKEPGVDIVKVHFIPQTSVKDRATDPFYVPPEDQQKVKADCIIGFLSMASYIKDQKLSIVGHEQNVDYYLLAATEPGLALFLITNCGFRGNARTGQAWVLASEFSASDNIDKMLAYYKQITD